jgi:class 3 adenylate cyclase
MEPQIQYAQASDGVSIAFWTIGEGTPFVLMPAAPTSPSLRAWGTPEGRAWFERLAAHHQLIRYDHRGFGHSQQNASDFSLDARVRDLTAVLDRLGLERVVLFGYLDSGPVAIAYATRFPERVSHLILWCTSAKGVQVLPPATSEALAALRDADWELYTEAMAAAVMRMTGTIDNTQRYAESFRETMTPETARAFAQAPPTDVSDLLAQVTTPTLVLHRRGVQNPPIGEAQTLAAGILNARLVVLAGDAAVPYIGDTDAVTAAIDDFLGEGAPASPEAPAAAPTLVTILFTDMESSAALRQQLGDAKAQELVRTHNTIVRQALKSHAGSEIKHTGDGIMASFPSAIGALDCAVAIQRGVATYLAAHPEAPLGVYVGLNAGEPIAEEQDLFGTSVDLARRLCDQAAPGEILVSNVVRELASGKEFLFSDRGAAPLKGFDDPVRLYEVRWRDA